MAAVAGDLAKTETIVYVSRGVKASQNISKGDLITFDANGYAQQATTSSTRQSGFGIAAEAQNNGSGADGALLLRIIVGGWAYCKAGGTIVPFALVSVASATTVTASSLPSSVSPPGSQDVNAAMNLYAKAFGRYMGHEGDISDETNAANADVIAVALTESI